MRHFISLLLLFSAASLFAQTDSTQNECINFDDYNLCYSAEYQVKGQKVGTICELSDLMLTTNFTVESFDIYFTSNGEMLSSKNNTGSFLEVLRPMIKAANREDFVIIVEINTINQYKEKAKYPSIVLSSCK